MDNKNWNQAHFVNCFPQRVSRSKPQNQALIHILAIGISALLHKLNIYAYVYHNFICLSIFVHHFSIVLSIFITVSLYHLLSLQAEVYTVIFAKRISWPRHNGYKSPAYIHA